MSVSPGKRRYPRDPSVGIRDIHMPMSLQLIACGLGEFCCTIKIEPVPWLGVFGENSKSDFSRVMAGLVSSRKRPPEPVDPTVRRLIGFGKSKFGRGLSFPPVGWHHLRYDSGGWLRPLRPARPAVGFPPRPTLTPPTSCVLERPTPPPARDGRSPSPVPDGP